MIKYIERTRAYYAAQGYPAYSWASYSDTPFAPMLKPLAESRVALMTTAAPHRPEHYIEPDTGPDARYNADLKFFEVFTAPIDPRPDLRISHIGYDRKHCAAEDSRTWLPIDALKEAREIGTIGDLCDELIGIPTNRSQRVTLEQDAPRALQEVENLGADVALLVPT